MHKIKIKDFYIGESEPLCVISGPCVIESKEHTIFCAESLKEIFSHFNINFIFKASFDKANRSSIHSFRGPGIEKGLEIIKFIKENLNLPVITDIHLPEHAAKSAEICDLLQIPAFLCRQTDLIVAAAKTKLPIHIKKAQFMSPHDMKNVVDKLISSGNNDIILTDRGTSFGYNNLISDMTSIPIMKSFGFPVGYDASHSVQKPGGADHTSGGAREFIPILTKAAVVSGANVIYIESHPDPKNAKSDSATVMPFDQLSKLMGEIEKIYDVIKEF
jgi:2-dehydro-3-deoxyphosphooctonate aldolase (KDO 8-P synthase)